MAPIKKQPHARRKTFLRAWREWRGFTLEAAAEKVGIDHSTLSRVEVGKSPYNQDMLEKLAFLYMCDATDLIAVDPAKADALEPTFQQLRAAPDAVQRQALAVVDAILKTRE